MFHACSHVVPSMSAVVLYHTPMTTERHTFTLADLHAGLRACGPMTAAQIHDLWLPRPGMSSRLTTTRQLRRWAQNAQLRTIYRSEYVAGATRRCASLYTCPDDPPTDSYPDQDRQTLTARLLGHARQISGVVALGVTHLRGRHGRMVCIQRDMDRRGAAPVWVSVAVEHHMRGERRYVLVADPQRSALADHRRAAAWYAAYAWPATTPLPLVVLVSAYPEAVVSRAWQDAWPSVRLCVSRWDQPWADPQHRWWFVDGTVRRDRILFEGWLPDTRYPLNNTRWDPHDVVPPSTVTGPYL